MDTQHASEIVVGSVDICSEYSNTNWYYTDQTEESVSARDPELVFLFRYPLSDGELAEMYTSIYDAISSAQSSMTMNPNGNMQNIRSKIPTESTATYGTPNFLSHFTITGGARLSSAREKNPLEPDAMYVLYIEH